jgi:predicted transcriptional regulator
MESRRTALILVLVFVASFLAMGATAPGTGMAASEAEYEDVELLFPDVQMSTKANSTVLALEIAERLGLGNVTQVSDDVYDPFKDDSSYYSRLYGPLTMRAAPELQYFDGIPYDEHVLTVFHYNQSDLMLVYGGDHPDAHLIALILDTGRLNATGEDEATREVVSIGLVETLGIFPDVISSIVHIEEADFHTVVLSGGIQGIPTSWCNLAAVKFSNTTCSVQRIQILPFVAVEQTYFSVPLEEASETCEQIMEDELDRDTYMGCELKSIRMVMVREVVQGEEVDEFNTTYSEVFSLRLGYEFLVTINSSLYSVDYHDLVVIDCNDGSTLLMVEGPAPDGAASPFIIFLPWFVTLSLVVVLIVMVAHFETSPEFAVLVLQSFLLPVYMRIRGAQALDSFNRGRIFEHVRMYPGSSFSGLKTNLGMGNGTLAYHLTVLQKLELVSSKKDGRERRYYLCGVNHRVRPDMWLGKTEAKVLEELVANGPMSTSNVAQRLQISRQRAHYNMRLLLKRGLAVYESPLWRVARDKATDVSQKS